MLRWDSLYPNAILNLSLSISVSLNHVERHYFITSWFASARSDSTSVLALRERRVVLGFRHSTKLFICGHIDNHEV